MMLCEYESVHFDDLVKMNKRVEHMLQQKEREADSEAIKANKERLKQKRASVRRASIQEQAQHSEKIEIEGV